MMDDDRIEGFMLGGMALTVANDGHAVVLALSSRAVEKPLQAALSVGQSKRLRRLLSAAEKRAA